MSTYHYSTYSITHNRYETWVFIWLQAFQMPQGAIDPTLYPLMVFTRKWYFDNTAINTAWMYASHKTYCYVPIPIQYLQSSLSWNKTTCSEELELCKSIAALKNTSKVVPLPAALTLAWKRGLGEWTSSLSLFSKLITDFNLSSEDFRKTGLIHHGKHQRGWGGEILSVTGSCIIIS